MTTLLALIGPNGILYALGAAVLAAFGLYMRSSGKRSVEAKQTVGKLKAAEDRLEMDREATAAERKVGELTDDEARKEAAKWSRH